MRALPVIFKVDPRSDALESVLVGASQDFLVAEIDDADFGRVEK